MKILLALDDYEPTWRKALRLARERQAELTVLFVLDNTWNVFVGHDWLSGSDSRADFLEWMRDEEGKASNETMAAFRALAGDAPFIARTAVGDVHEEVLKEARAGYDLLILSNPFSRGLEVVRKAVPGIAGDCPCDLLLVKKQPDK